LVNIKLEVADTPKTVKLFLENAYLKEYTCRVLKIIRDRGSRAYIVLDKSIFHPRGGGQPSDLGIIMKGAKKFEVRKVLEINGVLAHYGKLIGSNFTNGELVKCILNWKLRYSIMRFHTAGHILDYALMKVYGRTVNTLDAFHGPPTAYIHYEGKMPTEEKINEIEAAANEIVAKRIPVKIKYVNRENLYDFAFNAPNLNRLPKSNKYRIVIIENVNGIPCTGTHVANTGEIGRIIVSKCERTEAGFKLNYIVE